MDDFEIRIRRLAESDPNAPLASAISYLDKGVWPVQSIGARSLGQTVPTSSDIECLARFALVDPSINIILTAKESYGKIKAIKELRARANVGLKEAKDAIERAEKMLEDGWVPPEQQEVLRKEEEAAIQSILKGAS